MNGAIIVWNSTVTTGNWNDGSSWLLGTAPGNGDTATLAGGITAIVNSQVTIDTLITAANIKIFITNGGSLSVSNNATQAGTFNLQTDVGSTFLVNGYFIFTGAAVNFQNFGTVTLNPLVNTAIGAGVLNNVATGNDVVFSGGKVNLILADFNVPTGFTFASNAQSFIGGGLVTLAKAQTIAQAGWSFTNDLGAPSFVFNGGLNVAGGVSVTNQNTGMPRPIFTFVGTVTLSASVNFDVTPNFGSGGGISIINGNGNTLTFNNGLSSTFDVTNIQGNANVVFNSNNQFPVVTLNRDVAIDNGNVNFVGNWRFNGAFTLSFTTVRTFTFNATLGGASIAFTKPTTLASGSIITQLGAGSLTFTDGIVSNNGNTFLGFVPILDCTLPNKAFQVTGTSQLTFPAGLVVNGCNVTSSALLFVNTIVSTSGGNTTLPVSPTFIQYNASVAFTAANVPGAGIYSIFLNGQLTLPVGQTYTANNAEVIVANSLTVNDNGTLASASNGFFTLAGGAVFGNGGTVSGNVAFNSGSPTVTAQQRVNWSGNLFLRNTNLGGTADIWFTGGAIRLSKGQSTISNANFRFKGALITTYAWDGFFPNSGAQLVINSAGNTGTRPIEFGVTANQNTTIVFDDNLVVNGTITFTGSTTNFANIVFRTSGQAQASISTNSLVSLSQNIFFNHTNFHFLGSGSFQFVSTPTIYVQGGLNNPSSIGDTTVTSATTLIVNVVSNSTFGNTILLNGPLTTDDLDGNSNTANNRLTLNTTSSQSRNINGLYNLGTDLVFTNNVVVQTTSTIDSLGTIEIQGNSLSLQANANWNNKIVINNAFTVSATGSNTWTIGEQAIVHGFNIANTFTVNNPATVAFLNVFSVTFGAGSSLVGTGAVTATNTFFAGGAVTIAPQTLTLSNTSFVGAGPFNLQPGSSSLTVSTFVRALAPVTYAGSTLTLGAATTITNLFTFTAPSVTINGGFVLTVGTGNYNINTVWVSNNGGIVFQGAVTLGTSALLSGPAQLTFNNSLILSQNTVLSQNVVFGSNTGYIVTVANGGFVLTLTGNVITVNSIVVSNGGSIVSTSPTGVIQLIAGGGIINSAWTWSNSVRFGALNITGARTLTFNLFLTTGVTTSFIDGVTFNGGTFLPLNPGETPTLLLQNSVNTTVPTLLGPTITVTLNGATFTFGGASVLTLNGTFNTFSTVTFSTAVIFGYSTPTTGNNININSGTTAWLGSVTLQIWRNNINTANGVVATISPNLIFGLDTVSFIGNGRLTLAGNLNVLGKSFTTNANTFLSAITITSAQNNTLNGLVPLGTLTLSSTTSPWVEPLVSFSSGTLTQTIVLNGPARLNNPTFGPQSQVFGPSRLAITNSLTVNTAFQFNAPVQLYVDSASGSFQFNLNANNSFLTFSSTPSLFNPLGFNLAAATNFIVTSTNPLNILKFNLNSPLAIGDLTVTSGVLQLTGSSTSAYIVNVAGAATLWVDGTIFTSNQILFSQNADGSNPSFFQFTVSSLTPPAITTGSVVYKGVASVVVVNFNWDGTPVRAITATSSNSANFNTVIGTPGFTYTSTRTNNDVFFARSAAPTTSPIPTQSNGPSPAVSSSNIIVLNFALIVIILFISLF